MSVQSPWHMSACTSVCGFHNRQEGVIGSEVSRGGRRFVSVCATSFLCVVLSWLRTRGSSLLLCTTMEGFQSDAFYGNLFSSSCMQMKPEWLFFFFFNTVYCTQFCLPVILNWICSAAWFNVFIFCIWWMAGFLNYNFKISLSLRSLRSQSKEPPVYQSSPMKKGIYASLSTHSSLVWISLYSRCPSMKWLSLPRSLFIKTRVHFVRCLIPRSNICG